MGIEPPPCLGTPGAARLGQCLIHKAAASASSPSYFNSPNHFPGYELYILIYSLCLWKFIALGNHSLSRTLKDFLAFAPSCNDQSLTMKKIINTVKRCQGGTKNNLKANTSRINKSWYTFLMKYYVAIEDEVPVVHYITWYLPRKAELWTLSQNSL